MSDNWAMDLAREEQVYSSDSSLEIGWNAPNVDREEIYPDYGYVEQEKIHCGTGDDGYVSSVSCSNSIDACSEVSQEEEIDGRRSSHICGYRSDVKRLNKNRKQREREHNKKVYITKLKKVIIASNLIKVTPKGKKGFTEYDTLKYTRELIQVLISMRDRKLQL